MRALFCFGMAGLFCITLVGIGALSIALVEQALFAVRAGGLFRVRVVIPSARMITRDAGPKGSRCKYFSGDGGNQCQLSDNHSGEHSFCRPKTRSK
jgi:hypothetical protein